MKVVIKDPQYKKQDKSTQRSIDIGIEKLKNRLSTYIDQGKTLETIFGDNVLIHDCYEGGYYAYKCHINKIQLRLLYTLNKDKLIIFAHWIKKANYQTPSKTYMNYFENVCSGLQKGVRTWTQ